MKLGDVRGAIRKAKGNPVLWTRVGTDGPWIKVVVQKAPILDELERVFPGGKGVETGLIFDGTTNQLYREGQQTPPTASNDPLDTLDDPPIELLAGADIDLLPDADDDLLDI